MTGSEIVKALKCLIGTPLKCRECPYSPRFKFPLCQQAVAKDALSLIARQKEEIELLMNENPKYNVHAYQEFLNACQSKARREFAERFLMDVQEYAPGAYYYYADLVALAKDLLKEMESESDS